MLLTQLLIPYPPGHHRAYPHSDILFPFTLNSFPFRFYHLLKQIPLLINGAYSSFDELFLCFICIMTSTSSNSLDTGETLILIGTIWLSCLSTNFLSSFLPIRFSSGPSAQLEPSTNSEWS